MSDINYPHIRLCGGPLSGEVRYNHVGEILLVQELPRPDWRAPPDKPAVWPPKIGRYKDAGRAGRDGFWRFEWAGWY